MAEDIVKKLSVGKFIGIWTKQGFMFYVCILWMDRPDRRIEEKSRRPKLHWALERLVTQARAHL